MEAALRGEPAAVSFAYPRRVGQTPRNYRLQHIGAHERTAWVAEAEQAGRKSEREGDGLLNAWHAMRDYADPGRSVPESITKARNQD